MRSAILLLALAAVGCGAVEKHPTHEEKMAFMEGVEMALDCEESSATVHDHAWSECVKSGLYRYVLAEGK